ncbi:MULTISPECIES: response regulator transcription factor [unclassified Streptococcus]|uniref:response regulator transcription factor n=1 Tax=unclassified Streptococcus TaxID=2608887 RepID=UPI001071C0AF|nr:MULTISPECIES: response regulator transcription factor [unclassified Streptococcus]MBF0806680.1 response regulator transcription factor [Streptococcus sp. 19428wA2_WM07]TFU26691.1 response regulator transcription factor [Streptococcus sp. WM07]
MNIFVLEDDYEQQGRMENLLYQLQEKHDLPVKRLEVYSKTDLLLQAIQERGSHQLFFLDIEIKGDPLKGMDVANRIRQQDSQALIVFVTTHSKFMPLTFRYQISALDYIDKFLDKEDFEARVEAAVLYAQKQNRKTIADTAFNFKSKYQQFQIPFEDVYFLETSPISHHVVLYTKTERIEFFTSMNEVLKQEPRLYKCHRSYALNPKNVVKIDKTERIAYFPNKLTCFIARTKMKGILAKVEGEIE